MGVNHPEYQALLNKGPYIRHNASENIMPFFSATTHQKGMSGRLFSYDAPFTHHKSP